MSEQRPDEDVPDYRCDLPLTRTQLLFLCAAALVGIGFWALIGWVAKRYLELMGWL